MVVIETTKSGEEVFFFIYLWIKFGIAIDIGVHDERGRLSHNDLIANDCYTERSDEFFILNKDMAFIGFAIFIGILKNHNAVTLGVFDRDVRLAEVTVIDAFSHPDASLMIYIHISWVVEQGGLSPKSYLEIALYVKGRCGKDLFLLNRWT